MTSLEELRRQIKASKLPAAGQASRQFLPKGCLEQILTKVTLEAIICLPEFGVPPHKWDSTSSIISDNRDGLKVVAILVDLELENRLIALIEDGILDLSLPLEEVRLETTLSTRAYDFVQRQWEYLAHEFSGGMYQRLIRSEVVIPYTQQMPIGGGGFSRVYKVVVHPAHQRFISNPPTTGIPLIRKEILQVGASFSMKDESELMFLLGTLKHKNIIELVAAYIHDNRANLLLSPADLDLEQLLQQRVPYTAFTDSYSFYKAVHGLSSGLRYLHHAQYPSSSTNKASMLIGVHQDIKPRNILVRGNDLLLADFGLARLKPVLEGSRTTWKDATFEYGAPECRDPSTFDQGEIGRSSDIWSLGCVVLELLIHVINGSEGVESFREKRLTTEEYGRTRAFHNGSSLKEQVREELDSLKHKSYDPAQDRLISLLDQCLSTSPTDRPDAKGLENGLAQIIIEMLVNGLLHVTDTLIMGTMRRAMSTVFGTRFRLERCRLQAWAGLLDPSDPTPMDSITSNSTTESISEICNAINTATSYLEATDSASEESILSSLCLCNNILFANLTETERASVDARYAITVATETSADFLESVSRANKGISHNGNIGAIAAMKYMSILYSKQLQHSPTEPAIDQHLIEVDEHKIPHEIRPQIHFLNYGYLPNEKKRVLIERRSYGGTWNLDPGTEEFRRIGEAIFHRILELVALLRLPKPSNFHVLECAGAFHDADQQQFGIVYDLPDQRLSPVRLHHLLKGKGAPGLRPHIGQKLALAKALVKSVQTLHVSGWVHKNINSSNILFFTPSEADLYNISYDDPYLIGFEHSRQDTAEAWSDGPRARYTLEKYYRHLEYISGSSRFKRGHDYYSLGLVLVEIGVWERLSEINARYPTYNLYQLGQVYLKTCDKYILERMGPIYHAATVACLRDPGSTSDKAEYDDAMRFQRNVVDKLESCRF